MTVRGWRDGWLRRARPLPSPNFGARPAGTAIDLVVLHSISLPPGQYGGDAIERLFTNRLDWDAHPYYQSIRGLEVSAHFVVRRDGELIQFVSCDDRAWHAGASRWRGTRRLQRLLDRHRARGRGRRAVRRRASTRSSARFCAASRHATRSRRSPATSTSRRVASTIPAPVSTGRTCAASRVCRGFVSLLERKAARTPKPRACQGPASDDRLVTNLRVGHYM